MKNDEEIIESLIESGLIGSSLGAFLSKAKNKSSTIGTLALTTILATYKASEKAKETKLPIYKTENGSLFQVKDDGTKIFIKSIKKPNQVFESKFKLKH